MDEIDDDALRPFVDLELALAHPLVARLAGGKLRRRLSDELSATVDRRMRDPAWAARYAAACPVPGAQPDDYRLRPLALDDGRVLAGIHFLAGDVSHPFVGVAARTARLTDPDRLRRATDRLIEAFAPFAPREVWWFQPGGGGEPSILDLAGPERARIDQHLVAGPIAEIAAQPAEARVALHQSDPDAAHALVARIYAQWQVERPDLAARVPPADREQCGQCADAGLLFEIRVDGRRAGVIAGLPERARGLEGIVVIEEVLDAPWRGRGLAAAVQRRFAEHLPREGALFGTIDAANAPSLRTALRAGRTIVGQWVFVAPAC